MLICCKGYRQGLERVNNMKKVLFIGPVYYKYYDAIKKMIEETLPAKVDFIPHVNFGRLKGSFLSYFNRFDGYVVESVRYRIEKQISTNKDYDYVFVLKGGFLEKDTLKSMRQRLSSACFIYYNWDSFKRFARAFDIYKLFDKKFSFDSVDCEQLNDIVYLPLFHNFGDTAPVLLQPRFDLLFVGNRSSYRLEFIKDIDKQCKSSEFIFKCHMPTCLRTYLRERFINKDDIYRLSVWRTLAPEEYMNLLRRSRVAVDIENRGQSGLTIRTIETLAMGVKLITTNQNIQKESFYTPNNIMIVERDKPVIDPKFIKSEFEPMVGFYEKYSLKSWVNTLFGL